MHSIDHTIPGNSPAAIAGRAARIVRRNNAWKVRAGKLTRAALRRWARSIEAAAKDTPSQFAHWNGVVRT